MKFGDNSTEDDSNDASGTHVYFYQRGHDRLPGEEGDDSYEALAEAYEHAKTKPTKGDVRSYADNVYPSGFVQMLAEFTNTMSSCIEERSARPLIEMALEDHDSEESAEVLAQYLDQNPEVQNELVRRLKSKQSEDDE